MNEAAEQASRRRLVGREGGVGGSKPRGLKKTNNPQEKAASNQINNKKGGNS